MVNQQSSLNWVQKLSFGTGHVLNDLCASVWFSYLLVYLQYVLEIPSALCGVILLVGQVVDGIATPLIGIVSDHGKCCCIRCQGIYNYGRRKVWHLIGSVCVALSFPFLFTGCMGFCEQSNTAGYIAVLIFLVLVFQFGWAAVQISHLAMIPELTPVEAERDELNIIRFAFDIITDIMVYGIALIIFSQDEDPTKEIGPENGMDFTTLAISITGIGLFFTIIFHIGVKEKSDKSDGHKRTTQSLKAQWCGWFKNWHFYRVGLLYTAARLAHNGSIVFVPLYLQETKQSSQMLALIPLVMNIAGLLGSGLIKLMINCHGKKVSYALASTLGIISCIWLLVDISIPGNVPEPTALPRPRTLASSASDNIEFYFLSSIMGGTAAMVVVLSLTSAADLIDDKTDTAAFVYGCMSLCDKLASGVFVAFIQGLHSLICADGQCTTFYGQVLVYGVGIPFATVIVCSALAPKTPQHKLLEKSKDPSDYGSFQGDAPVVEFVY